MTALGPLQITFRPDPYPWEGNPAAGGQSQHGSAHVAAVTGPGGIAIDLGVITWAESREVAALDCYGSPPRIQRLGHGGRIGIRPTDDGQESMDLRISRMTDAEWSRPFQTSLAEVDTICRLDLAAALSDIGSTGVGSRAEVIGDTTRRKNELMVRFPAGDTRVPIAAYCAVRVLPLLYGHGQDNASLAG